MDFKSAVSIHYVGGGIFLQGIDDVSDDPLFAFSRNVSGSTVSSVLWMNQIVSGVEEQTIEIWSDPGRIGAKDRIVGKLATWGAGAWSWFSRYLSIACGSALTDNRTLTLLPGDADRTITLSGNPTLADWFDQSVKAAAVPQFAGLGIGTTGTSGIVTIAVAQAIPLRVERTNSNLVSIQMKNTAATAYLGMDSVGGLHWGPSTGVTANDLVTHPNQTLLVTTGSTTNATATGLHNFVPAANTAYVAEVTYLARVTGGSGTVDHVASFKRRVTFSVIAGTATILGSVETIGTDQKSASLSTATVGAAVIGGNTVTFSVTGVASTNVNWIIRLDIVKVS